MTAVSSKPLYLQPKPDAIPVPLKRWPSWVVWRGMYKPGEKKEWTKPPFRPDGSLADSTDTETWAPYDKVLRAYLNGEFDGIGLQLGGVPNLVGIDLDNCRDPATREIAGWALDIITALDTYFEVSPSATGVRGLLYGKLPTDGRKKGDVEVYSEGRYVTLTGHHIHGTPSTIEKRQDALLALHKAVFGEATKAGAPPRPGPAGDMPLDHAQIIEKAMAAKNGTRFKRLWEGDFSEYPSQSEADLALASELVFWSGGDPVRADKLFRQSALWRPKWDERHGAQTYGAMTIEKAMSGGNFYSGKRTATNTNGTGPAGAGDAHEHAQGSGEETWPALGELPQIPNPPAMPPSLIPTPLRDWVADIAERASIPLEYVACPAVIDISAVVGRRVAIKPRKHDDWLVVSNLWGGIVGRPGVLKSYALNEARKPLARLEAEARELHHAEEESHEAHRDRLEAQAMSIKADMVKAAKQSEGLDELEGKLLAIKRELGAANIVQRRYMTSDATVEKLGELLKENPRGILVARDELAGWLRTLEKAGREGDREFYLEAWNGNGDFTVDRIGRGTIYIPAVTVSIVGGIQPGKLRAYIDEATGDAGGADGLLQRLQLLVWPDGVGPWEDSDRWPNKEAKDKAFDIFKALDGLKLDGEGGGIPTVRFADDAQVLFNDWRRELENRLRSTELAETPAFESHLAKYRSLMPSLALLFHLIDVDRCGGYFCRFCR